MWKLKDANWFRAALVIGVATLPTAVRAISIGSNSRMVHVDGPKQPLQGTAASRTTPGAFVNDVAINDSSSSTSASQDSTLTKTATLIRIAGNGSTAADRLTSTVNSVQQLSESFFDTSFSLLNDSPYILSGILTVDHRSPLGGSPQFDNSFASIQLGELGRAPIFAADSNGSFNHSGILEAGKMYHLRIESKVFLQTNQIFSLNNGWSLVFLAFDVPEPTTIAFVLICALLFCAGRRRADGVWWAGL
jgi:hypothetical protein